MGLMGLKGERRGSIDYRVSCNRKGTVEVSEGVSTDREAAVARPRIAVSERRDGSVTVTVQEEFLRHLWRVFRWQVAVLNVSVQTVKRWFKQ